jgi:hypothetical protein
MILSLKWDDLKKCIGRRLRHQQHSDRERRHFHIVVSHAQNVARTQQYRITYKYIFVVSMDDE